MFVDLDWPLNASSLLSASAELLVTRVGAGCGVVRIDPLHFLARCRTRRLNQALSVYSLSLYFFECRNQTKLTDVLPLIIADRRHSLLGYVCRLPPDVPAHNIPQHCVNLSQGRCPAPDWKRPPGRPRKTWIQQVDEDHGCTIDSLWSSAQDRSLLRSLRPSLVRRSSEWMSACWATFALCYFILFVCSQFSVSWLFLLGCQYQCKWLTETLDSSP